MCLYVYIRMLTRATGKHRIINIDTDSMHMDCSCENKHCVTLLCIVPPQGCEAILIEMLQPKQYCLLVETPLSLVT